MGKVNDSNPKDAHEQLEMITKPFISDCGCSTISCCDEPSATINKMSQHTRVTIDGQVIDVTPLDKNIVDVARRAKIEIPAPCYRSQRRDGCCSACIIDVDGEHKFACSTVPEHGMDIVVNRADLKAIRKQRLLEYKEGIENGNPIECSLSGSRNCCS
jgi:predicted molibdopterin-dependent oxidoreductase YjgC